MGSVRAAAGGRSLAVFAVVVLAAFAASVARGAPQAGSSFLAPAAVCPGADDPAASAAVQQRAVGCLVNWARHHDRRVSLRQPASLRRASLLKGRQVVACAAFTHTPCDTGPAAAVRTAGYRFSSYGENLFFGPWGQVAPREVVAAWLASPQHRANILRPRFRDFGATFVRASGFDAGGDSVVWVATFGSPR
ncbi:MAG TPA: CAP domain-containing protein [Gaiellaceae bacterium]|nr:CAP domain-containing protein [Gaiellaceae bacterium]